jgi:hypothetical protein
MKYIDNLIAWGDNLFQRDTIESINEATLLYILAANILGKKPRRFLHARFQREFVLDHRGHVGFLQQHKVEVQSFISPSSDGIPQLTTQ